ncbi:MAG: L-histidine N(alpha)-methyltransferase [Candidatus Krumholzibacteriia bacterium]
MGMHPESVHCGDVVIDVRLEDQDRKRVLDGIRRGLLRTPREISPQFFYDEHGSQLFVKITELPEYYQTRPARALLERIADESVRESGAEVLVELGSGAATKTRVLLDAMNRSDRLGVYVPFDVSEGIVRRTAGELVSEYPGLHVHAVIGEFMEHIDEIPRHGRRLVIFLGGTIGNYDRVSARRFLSRVAEATRPGESFLLGTDLIKDTATVEAAYNDVQGVTAEFNRNILRVMNRVADGDFDPEGFEHRALYDESNHWIEMRLVASRAQAVRLAAIGMQVHFRSGDGIRTEISAKFDRQRVEQLLGASGFRMTGWYTDPQRLFALTLARRIERQP